MGKPWMVRTTVFAGLAAMLMLAGCAGATPGWGPNSPRNGAGQPVDATLGTPIPGYTLLPK